MSALHVRRGMHTRTSLCVSMYTFVRLWAGVAQAASVLSSPHLEPLFLPFVSLHPRNPIDPGHPPPPPLTLSQPISFPPPPTPPVPVRCQLGSGLLYIVPKYLLFAKMPSFSATKIALLSGFHGGGHYATVMSLGTSPMRAHTRTNTNTNTNTHLGAPQGRTH